VIVLGVDPGTAATGYGLVERGPGQHRLIECGVIRPPAGRPLGERLAVIFEELSAIVERSRPDAVAIEDVFIAGNVRSALVLGQARGMPLLVAARAGLEVAEYAPREVKAAIAGTGSATKAQIQLMVARHLRLKAPPQPADAADGVAIALTHILKHRVLRRAKVG